MKNEAEEITSHRKGIMKDGILRKLTSIRNSGPLREHYRDLESEPVI